MHVESATAILYGPKKATRSGSNQMAKKKKLTKDQIRAKARAYANKMTHGKAMDMYAFGGAGVDRTLRYMENKNMGEFTQGLPEDYMGIDPVAGALELEHIVRGFGASITRAGEKAVYKFLGIKGPRSEVKSLNDVIDYCTYHGAAIAHAYENKDNIREANKQFYKTHFGIDLGEIGVGGSLDDIQLESMIWEKEVPYIVIKKIRQIPFIKRNIAKFNKLF